MRKFKILSAIGRKNRLPLLPIALQAPEARKTTGKQFA
jgi:hypothetical protein